MKKHATITVAVMLAMLFAGGFSCPLFATAIPAEHAAVFRVEQRGTGVEARRGAPGEHALQVMAPDQWGPSAGHPWNRDWHPLGPRTHRYGYNHRYQYYYANPYPYYYEYPYPYFYFNWPYGYGYVYPGPFIHHHRRDLHFRDHDRDLHFHGNDLRFHQRDLR